MAMFGALGGISGQPPATPAVERNQFDQFIGSPGFGNALSALGMSLMSSPSNNPLQGFAPALEQAQTQTAREQQMAQEQKDRAETDAARQEMAKYAMSVVPDQLKGLAQTDPQGALTIWQQMQPKQGESFTLGAGEVRYGPGGEVIAQGGPDMGDSFGYEKDLYAQYTAAPPVKQYQDVKSGFERVRSSASADSGVGDLGVVYGFMKMLDPGSVVREGEFATAENTSGVPEQVMGMYNRLISGERLTPAQRSQFVQQAEQLYGETASNLSATNDQFSSRAQAWQVDPSRFVVQPEIFEPFGGASGAVDPLGIRR